MDWMQVGVFLVIVLGLGLAGMVYLARQLNRLSDCIGALEQRQTRVEERLGRVEESLDRLQVQIENITEGLLERRKRAGADAGFPGGQRHHGPSAG